MLSCVTSGISNNETDSHTKIESSQITEITCKVSFYNYPLDKNKVNFAKLTLTSGSRDSHIVSLTFIKVQLQNYGSTLRVSISNFQTIVCLLEKIIIDRELRSIFQISKQKLASVCNNTKYAPRSHYRVAGTQRKYSSAETFATFVS